MTEPRTDEERLDLVRANLTSLPVARAAYAELLTLLRPSMDADPALSVRAAIDQLTGDDRTEAARLEDKAFWGGILILPDGITPPKPAPGRHLAAVPDEGAA